MSIEEARAAFDDALITPRWADRAAILQAADEYALAVLDAVDKECPYHSGDLHPGAEGNCIERVSARIAALGQQEEGAHDEA